MFPLFAVTACAATPNCRLGSEVQSPAPANAGCMVRVDDHLLVVRDRYSGRLGFPAGGSIPPESAACTAHRETWEETGYRVEVVRLLAEFPGGFRLYQCQITEPVEVRATVPRPPQAMLEIEAIHWLNPYAIEPRDWRFPAQWPRALELFSGLEDDR